MSTDRLDCSVDVVPPVAHVSVRGTLAVDSAAVLRRTVLKALADDPAAVIIDLAGVTVTEPIVLTLFLSLSRAAAAWPGATLIAHSAESTLARQFEGLGIERHMPLADDRAAAEAIALTGPGPFQVLWDTTGAADPFAEARDRLRTFCRRHGLTGLSVNGELALTELLANALAHGRAPITIRISVRRRHLYVAVRDVGGGLPRLRGPDFDTGLGGRGLMIVEALTLAWGANPAPRGKVVWCCLGGPVSP
jgi:anti-anti-sigma regulatory factor